MNMPKFETDEIIAIPDSDVEVLLRQSKSTIHVYNYICAYTNNQKDIGYARSIKVSEISSSLNMPVETVTFALKKLEEVGLIGLMRVKFGVYDINILSYLFAFEDGYTQYPAEILFSDEFLSADKAVVAGYMYMHYVTFKDLVAKIRRVCSGGKAEYHKHLNRFEGTRTLKRKTIMTHIRRNNAIDVDILFEKIASCGWLNISSLSEFDYKEDDMFLVGIPRPTLEDIFKPKSTEVNYIENYKLSFRSAFSLVFNSKLEGIFTKSMTHLKDLTQMTQQYGKGLMEMALNKVKGALRDNRIVDSNGDEVLNICGYIRRTIEGMLTDMKDCYLRIDILDRYSRVKLDR